MWACFFRPSAPAPLLCEVQSAKRTSSGATGERKSKAALGARGAHRGNPSPANPTKEPPRRSPSCPSSHGRTPSRNAVSGPAPRFPWEYTVLPVCCYHLPVCAEEKQGSPEPSSRRTEVIAVLKRHFRVIPSRRGPQRRAEGRYCAARLHALNIQDVLGRGEARTKRELFPLL